MDMIQLCGFLRSISLCCFILSSACMVVTREQKIVLAIRLAFIVAYCYVGACCVIQARHGVLSGRLELGLLTAYVAFMLSVCAELVLDKERCERLPGPEGAREGPHYGIFTKTLS